jgi:ABC-2 type transport system permease protein
VAGGVIPAPKLAALWSNRRVLQLLVSRDVKVKYADSLLGYLWSVLEPLMMAVVYWFVFTQIFTRTVGEEPYIIFLLAGLLPWQWANSALRQSTTALGRDAKLVRSVNVPREIWVFRLVAAKFMEFVFALPVLALFAVLLKAPLSPYAFLFPLAVLLQTVLLVGCGLILAPLAAMYSDIRRLMRIAMRLLFFGTPVLYSLADVEARLGSTMAKIFIYNPLVGIMELYRAAFFEGEFVGWRPVVVSAVISAGLLVVGLRVFDRFEGRVLKEI